MAEGNVYSILVAVLFLAAGTGCEEDPPPRIAAEPVQALVSGRHALSIQNEDVVRSAEQFVALLDHALPPGVRLHVLPEAQPPSAAPPPAAMAVFLEVDLASFEPVLFGVSASGNPVTGSQVIEAQSAELVIGSGFVAAYQPMTPLGLLQIDGTQISELERHGYTRVLGLRAGELAVVGRRDYDQSLFSSAVQVGPGVIERGALDINERELKLTAYLRSLVVMCGPDRALIGISLRPMHLYNLGTALVAYVQTQPFACEEAINLSGDREVLLAIKDAEGQLVHYGNTGAARASLLGFRRKARGSGGH